MKPHPRIRRPIKWGGMVVAVFLAFNWVTGVCWTCGRSGEETIVAFNLEAGGVGVYVYQAYWVGRFRMPEPMKSAWWFFHTGREWLPNWQRPRWRLEVPVTVTLPLALGTSAMAWYLERKSRRRLSMNVCLACGYPSDGLPAGALCPECGGAPAASITAADPLAADAGQRSS